MTTKMTTKMNGVTRYDIKSYQDLVDHIPNDNMKDLFNYFKTLEANKAYNNSRAMFQTIITMSALTSGYVHIKYNYESWGQTTTNLYTALIANTGAGKSVTINGAFRPFKKEFKQLLRNKVISGSRLNSKQAMLQGLDQNSYYIKTSDEIGEDLNNIIRSNHDAMQAFLEGYSYTDTMDGTQYASKKEETISVSDVAFSYIGVSTYTALQRTLNRDTLGNGLVNRFLFLPGLERSRLYDQDQFTSTIISNLRTKVPDHMRIVLKILSAAPRSIELKVTKGWIKMVEGLIGDTEEIEGVDPGDISRLIGGDELKSQLYQRIRENAIRISIAIAAYNRNDHVSEKDLAFAYSLVKFSMVNFKNLMSDVYDDEIVVLNNLIKLQDKIDAGNKIYQGDIAKALNMPGEHKKKNNQYIERLLDLRERIFFGVMVDGEEVTDRDTFVKAVTTGFRGRYDSREVEFGVNVDAIKEYLEEEESFRRGLSVFGYHVS